MDLLTPGNILSFSGVVVAGLAFVNRDRPDWQRAMPVVMAIAIGQVILGMLTTLLVR